MLATNEAGKVPHPLELCFPDNARVWSLASMAGPSDWVNGGQDKELGSLMHAGGQGDSAMARGGGGQEQTAAATWAGVEVGAGRGQRPEGGLGTMLPDFRSL